jgi:phosphopantothenoylcysteine synthetase/decarboxylase
MLNGVDHYRIGMGCMSLTGKKVLITSGGTLEKWDLVRGHTNLAKGTMGCHLAEEALSSGAEVIYLHGYFAGLPQNHDRMRVVSFEGIQDLSNKIEQLVRNEPIHSVIMAAAVSDWVVDKIVGADGEICSEMGKISSDNPPVIHFKKAPKVITEIKSWNPSLILVGFKLEHNADYHYLMDRSRQRMDMWRADYVVANTSGSLYSDQAAHYIVSKDGSVQSCTRKSETAQAIIRILENR